MHHKKKVGDRVSPMARIGRAGCVVRARPGSRREAVLAEDASVRAGWPLPGLARGLRRLGTLAPNLVPAVR